MPKSNIIAFPIKEKPVNEFELCKSYGANRMLHAAMELGFINEAQAYLVMQKYEGRNESSN